MLDSCTDLVRSALKVKLADRGLWSGGWCRLIGGCSGGLKSGMEAEWTGELQV